MASNDLARHYAAKKTLENYLAIEKQNRAVMDKELNETSPIRKSAEGRIAALENKLSSLRKNTFYLNTGWKILLVGFLLIGLLIVGSLSFLSPYVSPDLGIVAERYDGILEEDEEDTESVLPGLNGVVNFNPGHKEDEETSARASTFAANEAATLCFGNIILITLLTGFIFLVIYFMNFEEGKKEEGSLPLIAFFFLFALLSLAVGVALPALGRAIWGLHPDVGTLSLLFGGLVASIGGIGKIFSVTYSFALFVLILDLLFYGTLTVFFVKREKYVFHEETNKKAIAIKEKMANIKKESESKCKAIYEKYFSKIKPNPYDAAYNRLPIYQRNYSTVTSLIWAIENGYASDIVSARNYWDRKAHDAAVQRQLEQIQATSDAALREAQAAKIAAEAPVDVNVTIYH
jgi:hypothetical protein